MKPTNSPTQHQPNPRKHMFFSWVEIDFIKEIGYKNPNPTKFSAIAFMSERDGGRDFTLGNFHTARMHTIRACVNHEKQRLPQSRTYIVAECEIYERGTGCAGDEENRQM